MLHRKRTSMLTGLKVSSLTCKCLFYRPEQNAFGFECRIKLYQRIELKE